MGVSAEDLDDAAEKSLADSPRCPICSTALTRPTVVLCEVCSAPHHRRCWSFNKGCGTYGCGSRAFVAPPWSSGGQVGPRIEFRRLGRGLDVTWVAWATVFCAAGFLNPQYLLPALLAAFLPLLLETRYTLDPEAEAIEQRRYLGPVLYWRNLDWMGFPEVEEVEVRERLLPGRRIGKKRLLWEVWVRDRSGHAYRLGEEATRDMNAAITKVKDAALQIDTVVSLPRRAAADAALPPGLEDRLRKMDGTA